MRTSLRTAPRMVINDAGRRHFMTALHKLSDLATEQQAELTCISFSVAVSVKLMLWLMITPRKLGGSGRCGSQRRLEAQAS